MITIELTGGLGNQMFQFALAIKMKHLGRKVCIKPLFSTNTLRQYGLGCFKGVEDSDVSIIYPNESSKTQSGKNRLIKKIIKKITPDYMDEIIVYQKRVLKYRNANLFGYWQNEKYFSDIRDIILETFTFKKNLVDNWNSILRLEYGENITSPNENSVSVHVRCTDYRLPINEELYGGICTFDYYERAIKYISEKIKGAVFYFFSDDMNWVKCELIPYLLMNHMIDYKLVDFEHEDPGTDMWLMTKCKHHIIANSTYSWWGAWLGTNEDKIVVAPSKWMNGYSDDIICDNWIKI